MASTDRPTHAPMYVCNVVVRDVSYNFPTGGCLLVRVLPVITHVSPAPFYPWSSCPCRPFVGVVVTWLGIRASISVRNLRRKQVWHKNEWRLQHPPVTIYHSRPSQTNAVQTARCHGQNDGARHWAPLELEALPRQLRSQMRRAKSTVAFRLLSECPRRRRWSFACRINNDDRWWTWVQIEFGPVAA